MFKIVVLNKLCKYKTNTYYILMVWYLQFTGCVDTFFWTQLKTEGAYKVKTTLKVKYSLFLQLSYTCGYSWF